MDNIAFETHYEKFSFRTVKCKICFQLSMRICIVEQKLQLKLKIVRHVQVFATDKF